MPISPPFINFPLVCDSSPDVWFFSLFLLLVPQNKLSTFQHEETIKDKRPLACELRRFSTGAEITFGRTGSGRTEPARIINANSNDGIDRRPLLAAIRLFLCKNYLLFFVSSSFLLPSAASRHNDSLTSCVRWLPSRHPTDASSIISSFQFPPAALMHFPPFLPLRFLSVGLVIKALKVSGDLRADSSAPPSPSVWRPEGCYRRFALILFSVRARPSSLIAVSILTFPPSYMQR